jgi:23S rRNA pseudouridine1911/1915/1917 synthase
MIGPLAVPRVMLHAKTLGFHHPLTGDLREFTRGYPTDMGAMAEELERLARGG